MNIKKLFEQLLDNKTLSDLQMQQVIYSCMTGKLSDAQIAAFLVLMRTKGETVAELTAAATTMRDLAHPIDLGSELIDIVGTGGDGKNTFNVSTISSFVAAAAGLNVAKHGNRASSSRSGSADLLTEAGFVLNLSDEALRQCMQQCNIAFLFGPHFHQAMQHVRNARQQLGIRTLFNLLGPLLNPAKVKKQVVGVFSKYWLKPVASVLANLGSEHALVVHSDDGLDEISIAACSDVVEYHAGEFKQWTIDPSDYGCSHANLDAIIVETPAQSLAIAESVFAGSKGPARDIVLLNTAAALYCADSRHGFADAVQKAAGAIDSGRAGQRFNQLRELTKHFAPKPGHHE
jgi:anthranilate phosphoribosyltransferase